MGNKSLCDSCMYAGSCADSDKGLSFANHTICWKYVEDKKEAEHRQLPEIKNFGMAKKHDPRSKELFDYIEEVDFANGDYFCFKSGGDGDNGEILMDLLDCFFRNVEMAGSPDSECRQTYEWIPVKDPPKENGFYLVTALGYGKRPYIKFLGYDAIGKKWGEGGVVAWCNISPYKWEAEE